MAVTSKQPNLDFLLLLILSIKFVGLTLQTKSNIERSQLIKETFELANEQLSETFEVNISR